MFIRTLCTALRCGAIELTLDSHYGRTRAGAGGVGDGQPVDSGVSQLGVLDHQSSHSGLLREGEAGAGHQGDVVLLPH